MGAPMCFCALDFAAQVLLDRDPNAYFAKAHEMMHHSRGIVPLCVNATFQGSSSCVVTCTSLAGNVVARFDDLSAEHPFAKLSDSIRHSVPLPAEATLWRIILPDGSVPGEAHLGMTLRDVLNPA